MRSAKILNVFWHSVDGDCSSVNRVNPTTVLFREHIKFLAANFTLISLLEFFRMRQDKRYNHSYHKPPLLLGFDDGFRNVIRYALPILEEFEAPAVFFVIGEILKNPDFVPWYVEMTHMMRRTVKKVIVYRNTNINPAVPEQAMKLRQLFLASFRTCGSESERQMLLTSFADALGVSRPVAQDLDEDLKFVDEKDLNSLPSSSLLTIASHAMTHRDLANLSYEEQLDELQHSDSLLRKHCRSYYPVLAYPNGSFNAHTVSIATKIYRAGFASFLGASYRNLYAYPRICIGNDSVEELAYTVSSKRLKYILPVKRFLHVTGIRPV